MSDSYRKLERREKAKRMKDLNQIQSGGYAGKDRKHTTQRPDIGTNGGYSMERRGSK